MLRILLTEAERKALNKTSKSRGMEVSTWARTELLGIAGRGSSK